MKILEKIDPQPPRGIKYMLGDETWLSPEQRSPMRMHCEEWGHLGPLVIDPSIKPNKAGFRVRSTEIPAPAGAIGFTSIDGIYYWTDRDMYGRSADERALVPNQGATSTAAGRCTEACRCRRTRDSGRPAIGGNLT